MFAPPTRAQLTDRAGLSLQTVNILPKIREVDAWLAAHPEARAGRIHRAASASSAAACGVHEAHPELAFAQAAGAPMRHPKRTLAGRAERARVLRRLSLLPAARPRGCALDDLHDASILAWTARRIRENGELVVGEAPMTIRA